MSRSEVIQLEARNTTAGDRDNLNISYEGNRLSALRFTPQRRATDFSSKIGMTFSSQASAVFRWKGVKVNGGKTLQFKTLPNQRGVELKNESDEVQIFELLINTTNGTSAQTTAAVYGPFTLPVGAIHQAIINDWPLATAIRSSIDRNGDGTFEETAIVSARAVLANVSSASYRGATIARGSLVSAFGDALATGVEIAASLPLPTRLKGTSVSIIDSAGKGHAAALFFVSPFQINYYVPVEVATGAAKVMIHSGDGNISIQDINVVDVSPGLFTANASGKGTPAAQILRVTSAGKQSYEPVAIYDPQKQSFVPRAIEFGNDDLYLILYGTGIRLSRPDETKVTIGGQNADVFYVGESPGLIGLDQVNVRLPRSLQGKGSVSVSVTNRGQEANPVEIEFK